MSSIISDLFYGSKQNILDHYLIHRHQQHAPYSVSQEQSSAADQSCIQLTIRIPNTQGLPKPQLFKITAEMGSNTDEALLQVKQGHELDTPTTTLTLNNFQLQDLRKATNIKITFADGKLNQKVFGYIPIEVIQNLINHPKSQKTLTIQMKGKTFIGFHSVQCSIKTKIANLNVLDSEILKSINKDYSSLSKNYEQTPVNDGSQFNTNSKLTENERGSYFPQQTLLKIRKPFNKRQSLDSQYFGSQMSNVYVEDEFHIKAVPSPKRRKPPAQYTHQICSVKLIFSRLILKQDKHEVPPDKVSLKYQNNDYQLNKIVQLSNFTKEGVELEVCISQKTIGKVLLNPLLLTLTSIHGQLPLYSTNQECIGTILAQTPQSNISSTYTTKFIKSPQSQSPPSKHPQQRLTLLSLNINKIILINSTNPLDDSSYYIDPKKAALFDFTKIQADNRLQLVVRIDSHSYKLTDIAIRYIARTDELTIVELKRKQGFFLKFLDKKEQQQLNIELQLYSNYQLLSFSRLQLVENSNVDHYFVPGCTEWKHCHCALHLQALWIQTPPDYFSSTQPKLAFSILEDLVTSKIAISNTNDDSIKKVMNQHPKSTYVYIKKLFVLLQPIITQLTRYQHSSLKQVICPQKKQISEQFVKFSKLLQRQLSCIDIKGEQSIGKEQFQKILHFYRNQYLIHESQEFAALNQHLITNSQGSILYPFFIAGFYLMQEQQPIQFLPQQSKQEQLPPTITQNIRQEKQAPSEIAVLVRPTYFIQKITLTNTHLLNQGKIPNVSIGLSKKTHYSNANPDFIVEKEVNLSEPIKIYHKNLSSSELILLASFQPNRKQIHYELDLTGKSQAKIQWGH